jgi:small subunit ribosomal protein S21
MPSIEVSRCRGQVEIAIRRLKRLCDRLGIHKSLREREHYVKPTTKRRKDRASARKRLLKKQSKELRYLTSSRRKRQTITEKVVLE